MLTSYVRGRHVQFYGKNILVKLTRAADVKIDMFKQAHRLAGSYICKVFGDPYTWGYTMLVHSRDSLQPEP